MTAVLSSILTRDCFDRLHEESYTHRPDAANLDIGLVLVQANKSGLEDTPHYKWLSAVTRRRTRASADAMYAALQSVVADDPIVAPGDPHPVIPRRQP